MNESLGFYIVTIIAVCMAWIWRKLKDIETQNKERDAIQQKHNKHMEFEISVISHSAKNTKWEKRLMGELDMDEKE